MGEVATYRLRETEIVAFVLAYVREVPGCTMRDVAIEVLGGSGQVRTSERQKAYAVLVDLEAAGHVRRDRSYASHTWHPAPRPSTGPALVRSHLGPTWSPSEDGQVTFGAALKRERERSGFSIEKLARQLGISKSYLHSVEIGRSPPFARMLVGRAEVALRSLADTPGKLLTIAEREVAERAIAKWKLRKERGHG